MVVKRRQKGRMWGWKIREKILQLGGGVKKKKKKYKKNKYVRKCCNKKLF